MLSESDRRLLTAYLDGELTTREREAAVRLLRESREARALVRALQADAARIAKLPRLRLGPDFTDRVVRAAREQEPARRGGTPAAVPGRGVAAGRSVPWWVGPAVAAAVLLAVSAGSFLYFGRPSPRGPGLVASDTNPPPAPLPGPEKVAQAPTPGLPDPLIPERLPVPPAVEPAAPGISVPDPPASGQATNTGNAANTGNAGKPVPPEPSALTVPLDDMEMFQPAVASVALMPLVNVRDIEAGRLSKEFARDSAFHVELPCRETAVGVRRLEAALKSQGVQLVIDPSALNRLSKPRLKTNFAVWVEDLTAEELARVLARLGSDDKKAAQARPQPDGQFSKMVLNPLSDADRKELAQLLRADLRPVTAAKPTAKAERLALLVAYNPERPQADSPQLKRYFDSRRPLHTGGLQALLVLREARN